MERKLHASPRLMEFTNCTSAYLTSCFNVFQIFQTNRHVCFLNEHVEFFVAIVNLLLFTIYIINIIHDKKLINE